MKDEKRKTGPPSYIRRFTILWMEIWKGLSTEFKCENTQKEKKKLKKVKMNCLWDLLGRQNDRVNLTLVNLSLEANEKSLIHGSDPFHS
jgi:hypothetical protein